MNTIRLIARAGLIILMIAASAQLAWAILRLVAAIRGNQADAISYMIGRLVASILMLLLSVLGFRKLGA